MLYYAQQFFTHFITFTETKQRKQTDIKDQSIFVSHINQKHKLILMKW